MLCKNCNQNIPDNSVFCPNCGSKIISRTNPQPVRPNICPSCGNKIKNNALSCAVCGFTLTPKNTSGNYAINENEPFAPSDIYAEELNNMSSPPAYEPPAAKSNTALIWVLIGVSSLALVAILALLFINIFPHHSNTDIYIHSADHQYADDYNDYDEDDEYYNYYEDDDYLFPSDSEYITTAYLDTLSREEIALIRNEIYARHGYVFHTEPFISYFNQKDWYYPDPTVKSSDAILTRIELANKNTIVEYEKKQGWR